MALLWSSRTGGIGVQEHPTFNAECATAEPLDDFLYLPNITYEDDDVDVDAEVDDDDS